MTGTNSLAFCVSQVVVCAEDLDLLLLLHLHCLIVDKYYKSQEAKESFAFPDKIEMTYFDLKCMLFL